MKKKNMIMVGLLVLVCVLFLAVGYAGITKKITAKFSVGGKANPDSFVIKYGDLSQMNRDGLNAFTFSSSDSFYDQVGVLSTTTITSPDGNPGDVVYSAPGTSDGTHPIIIDDITVNAYGLNVKGEKITYYIPIINMSNDLRATKFTATTPELTGTNTASVNCGEYYSVKTSLVKYNGNKGTNNPANGNFYILQESDFLKPYSEFVDALADWKTGKSNSLFFLKVEIETLVTLPEDTSYDYIMSPMLPYKAETNYCQWKVDVQAEAAVNK